ncbi:hypothetical protein [Streptomyces wuyuanensis]|uniref:hypothetical protein n=1 Tax=Streptomyces wuyuanensis TaxID=1196353 RepID=UPI0037A48904
MGIFRRNKTTEPTVTLTGEELTHAARELNNGNDGPANALVERGGSNEGLRSGIALRIMAASIDAQD